MGLSKIPLLWWWIHSMIMRRLFLLHNHQLINQDQLNQPGCWLFWTQTLSTRGLLQTTTQFLNHYVKFYHTLVSLYLLVYCLGVRMWWGSCTRCSPRWSWWSISQRPRSARSRPTLSRWTNRLGSIRSRPDKCSIAVGPRGIVTSHYIVCRPFTCGLSLNGFVSLFGLSTIPMWCFAYRIEFVAVFRIRISLKFFCRCGSRIPKMSIWIRIQEGKH